MPHRPMRRQDRQLSESEAREILERAEWGTLATVNSDGSPYLVPLNFVVTGNQLFFHCATEGHKLDNIRSDSRVCFNVAVDVRVLPDVVSTAFRSVTVNGRARLADPEEKGQALSLLLRKYTPMSDETIAAYLERRKGDALLVMCLEIESISGKRRPDPSSQSC